MFRVNYIFCAYLLVVFTNVAVGQQSCVDVPLNLSTCLLENVDTCFGCNTSTTSFEVPSDGNFTCSGIESQVCPSIKCCRACEGVTYDLVQCALQPLSFFLGTCNLNCSAFPYGDTNINNTNTCISALASWTKCLSQDGQNCSSCGLPIVNSSSIDSCDAFGNLFCDQISCCPSCQDEARTFYDCIVNTASNDSNCTLLGDCTKGSPTAVTATPSAPTSVLATTMPNTPTTPAPSSAAVTTPAPSAVVTASSPNAGSVPVAVVPTSSSACPNGTDALVSCFTANIFSCAKCIPIAYNLSGTTEPPKSCQEANNLACPLSQCCPKCSGDVQAFFECNTGGQSALTSCLFNCTTSAAVPMAAAKWGFPILLTSVFTVLTSIAII